jgi:hypothetical protein
VATVQCTRKDTPLSKKIYARTGDRYRVDADVFVYDINIEVWDNNGGYHHILTDKQYKYKEGDFRWQDTGCHRLYNERYPEW